MRTIRALAAAAIATLIILPAAAEDYLFDALKKPANKKAWATMMKGVKDLPPWIAQISKGGNYVGTPVTNATVGDGTDIYTFYRACKAHDCADNKLEVVFTADGSRAFAVLVIPDKPPRWFGAPDATMQAALTKAIQD